MKKAQPIIILVLALLLIGAIGYIVVDHFGGFSAIKANVVGLFNGESNEEELGRGGPNVTTDDEEECLGAGCGPEKVLPVIPVSDPKQDGLDLYRFAAMGKTIDEGVQALINLYNPNNGSVDCKNGCTLNLAAGKIVAAWTDWCGPAPAGAVELLPGSTDGGYGLWLLTGGHKYELLKGGYHPALPAGYDTFDFGSVDMSRLIGASPKQAVDIVIGFFNEIEGSKNCANGCTITVRQGERWLVGTDWQGAPPKGAIAAVPSSQEYGYGAFQLLPGTYTLKNGVAVPLGK